MPSGKIKAKDLGKLRTSPLEPLKKVRGHTVTRAQIVIKSERDYDRKRDKRVTDKDLE